MDIVVSKETNHPGDDGDDQDTDSKRDFFVAHAVKDQGASHCVYHRPANACKHVDKSNETTWDKSERVTSDRHCPKTSFWTQENNQAGTECTDGNEEEDRQK